jgi:hypothetical protein
LKVDLLGAQIGVVKPSTLINPDELAPLGGNPAGAPFDVTYEAGSPVVITVNQGGAPGRFRGTLEGAPECLAHWCDIVWPGQAKSIALHLAGGAPIDLNGRLPGEATHLVPWPHLSEVTLEDVRGTLACGDVVHHFDGDDLHWLEGRHAALEMLPIRAQGNALQVIVRDESAPQPHNARREAIPVFVFLGLAAVGFWWFQSLPNRRAERAPSTSGKPSKSHVAGEEDRSTRKENQMRTGNDSRKTGEPVKVFISYAPEDESFRAELEKHLALLKRQRFVQDWSSRHISVGGERDREMKHRLEQADMVLILLSANFLASDHLYDTEMMRALERQDLGEAKVIAINLSPVDHDFEGSPISRLEMLPQRSEPITSWKNRDEAWTTVVQGIRAAIEALRRKQAEFAV